MSEQEIFNLINFRFPGITVWKPRNKYWKGRHILIGYKLSINNVDCYVFIGKDGLGRQHNHQQETIPYYSEIALVSGGVIYEKLGKTFDVIDRLLPNFKRKKSYYRYVSFCSDQFESAGQSLIDVISVLWPQPVL